MYVPMPFLVAAGLALLLFAWLLLGRRGERDLMAPPSGRRAAPPSRPAPPVPTGMLETELRTLLGTGHKLAAIKRAREVLDLGLAEAKELVEAIERGAVLEPTAAAAGLNDELRLLVAQGRKIEAIKRAREALGLGLAEAKDFVESIASSAP
jgi:ribosomal protein L7/L12